MRSCVRAQEFLVLSSQPMSMLRDAFYCLADSTAAAD
jgi:hypothetical protein